MFKEERLLWLHSIFYQRQALCVFSRYYRLFQSAKALGGLELNPENFRSPSNSVPELPVGGLRIFEL
jgi:hypothetical protein